MIEVKRGIQKQRAMNDGIQQTHRCASNIRKKVFISTKKIRLRELLKNAVRRLFFLSDLCLSRTERSFKVQHEMSAVSQLQFIVCRKADAQHAPSHWGFMLQQEIYTITYGVTDVDLHSNGPTCFSLQFFYIY